MGRLLPTGLGLFVPIGRQRLIGGLDTVRLSRSACAWIGLFTTRSVEGGQVPNWTAPPNRLDPVVSGMEQSVDRIEGRIGLPTPPIP